MILFHFVRQGPGSKISIIIKTAEKLYQVERQVIIKSQMIKKMLEDLDNIEVIPLLRA